MVLITTCRFVCLSVLVCLCHFGLVCANDDCEVFKPLASNPGDINVVVFLNAHPTTDEETCGWIHPFAVQELEIINYIFDKLNEISYIPGKKLGTIAYDTCSLMDQATRNLRHVFQKLDTFSVGCSNDSLDIFGIAGPPSSDEAFIMGTILQNERGDNRLPVITHSATATRLTSSPELNHVYSVVPPDNLQAKVMVELLVKLGWNYVALMHSNNTYGKGGAEDILRLANDSGICFAFVEPVVFSVQQLQLSFYRLLMLGGNSREKVSGIVFFGSSQEAHELLQFASNFEQKLEFIFSDAVQSNPARFEQYSSVSAGSLVVGPMYKRLSEFEDHLKELYTSPNLISKRSYSNPLVEELYRNLTNCPMETSLSQCSPLRQSEQDELSRTGLFTYQMARVAYLYANLIKNVYDHSCIKSFTCTARNITLNELARINVTFPGDFGRALLDELSNTTIVFGLEHNRFAQGIMSKDDIYEIKNYQRGSCPISESDPCFVKVGGFDGDRVSVDLDNIKNYEKSGSEVKRTISKCPVGSVCEACIKPPSSKRWVYIPGDLIVVALIPVYNAGSDPYTCSGVRLEAGLQLAEAVMFALDKANRKQNAFDGVFHNKTFGALFLNTCFSETVSLRGTGSVFLEDDAYLRHEVKDISSKLIGFVGGLKSDASQSVASLLTKQGVVQISYGSTSAALDNREAYPYFARTCASDSAQSIAIIQLLKHLGWKYFSIVYVDDSYGQSGYNLINKMAPENGLCIAEAIKITREVNFFSVLEILRRSPSAGAVVLFVRSYLATAVLQAFSKKEDFWVGEFTFILTESTGDRLSVVESSPVSEGSFSLLQEAPEKVEFNEYLREKGPAEKLPENSWFSDYFSEAFKCNLPESYNKSFTTACKENATFTDGMYSQDPWAPMVINAVFSLLLGADRAAHSICGTSLDWCPDVRRRPDVVMREILKTRLDISGSGEQTPVFDDNGNGLVGYHILQVMADECRKLGFKKVGGWNASHGLLLHKDLLIFPERGSIPSFSCPNPVECSHCRSVSNSSSVCDGQQNSTCSSAIYSVVGILSAVVICLIVSMVVVSRKLQLANKEKLKIRENYADYLHAMAPYSSIQETDTDSPSMEPPGFDEAQNKGYDPYTDPF